MTGKDNPGRSESERADDIRDRSVQSAFGAHKSETFGGAQPGEDSGSLGAGSSATGSSYGTTGSSYGSSQSVTEKTEEKAADLTGQVRESAHQVADKAREQVTSRLSSQKDRAAEGLSGVAQALRQTGEHLRSSDQSGFAHYAEDFAGQIDRFTDYLRNRSVGDLVDEAERFARREPGLFLGAAFAIGLLGARFLKSSAPRRETAYSGAYGGYQGGYGSDYGRRYGSEYGRGYGSEYGRGSYGRPEYGRSGEFERSDRGASAGRSSSAAAVRTSYSVSEPGAGQLTDTTGRSAGSTSTWADTDSPGSRRPFSGEADSDREGGTF